MKLFSDNRGIALLVTLSVTTLLIAVAIEYNRRARFSVISTAMARNGISLRQMAAAGVHAGMAILVKDKADSTIDSLLEDWANPDKVSAVLEEMPFENGTLTVAISDELGKIQANALVSFPEGRQFNPAQLALWERFLAGQIDQETTDEDRQPAAIINSIKDWLDGGDDDAITGLTGAESSHYQELDPAYACRNGPIADLEELLMVKGITPDLFHGNAEKPGIERFLTVYGLTPGAGTAFTFPGRININTAELPVLLALLPPEYADLVETMAEIRQEIVSGNEVYDFSDPAWYKNLPGLSDVKLDQQLVGTASDVFRIEATAGDGSASVTITAVIERIKDAQTGKWSCRILEWVSG
jgi:general secretion pathway protein K